jgi:hypothetical protein
LDVEKSLGYVLEGKVTINEEMFFSNQYKFSSKNSRNSMANWQFSLVFGGKFFKPRVFPIPNQFPIINFFIRPFLRRGELPIFFFGGGG